MLIKKRRIKKFIEYLESNPFIGNQESCGRGKDYWNADMWTIQVSKCLYYGYEYTVPDKFKDNCNADLNRIKSDANIKLNVMNILQDIKDSADCLLICESGRLLDGVIANQVKEWKKVYCYDHVNYEKYLNIFDNIEFIHTSTNTFDPKIIKEKCIMIMNHSLCRNLDKFKINNIIHAIVDGEVKW